MWAYRNDIPFLHLRGGARGCAATRCSKQELEHWRVIADATAPIRLLTADVTLHDLAEGPDTRAAQRELARTVRAASLLGVTMTRILADRAPVDPGRVLVPRLPKAEITFLIEPHDRWWWTVEGIDLLSELTGTGRRIRLLADTAQAATGLAATASETARARVREVVSMSSVVHISDNGSGFGAKGHALLAAQTWQAQRAGQRIEVAFEWTGPERTKPACLSRYHAARAWWQAQDGNHHGGHR
ncbi:hypothetical protein ACWDUL_20380 [Nocardia niigatensis]